MDEYGQMKTWLLQNGFLPDYARLLAEPEKHGLLLDYPELFRRLEELGETYRHNTPFPHIVIDDFLSGESLRRVIDAFPAPEADIPWKIDDYQTAEGKPAQAGKMGFAGMLVYPPVMRLLFLELQSPPVVFLLETLTGINGLVPDPHLMGGGLHQIRRGGSLRVHADFNVHPLIKLDRRINLLIYLNEDWDASYGGHLELWEKDMSRAVHRVLPIAGRCVLFNTTSDAYHGHPEPLTCPEDRTRKSIALYYYTAGRPEEEKRAPHPSLWQDRPTEVGS